jgi:hypothetical protein
MPFEVTPVFPHLTRLALDAPGAAPKTVAAPQVNVPAAISTEVPATETAPVSDGSAAK